VRVLRPLVGGLGLCFAFHGLISRALETAALRGEIEALREAHRIVIDQMERMDKRVSEVVEITTVDAQRRSEELTSEVHLLEDLVQRMSLKLEERPSAPAASGAPRESDRNHRQSVALLETVRQALADNRVDLYLQPVVNLPQRRTVFYEASPACGTKPAGR